MQIDVITALPKLYETLRVSKIWQKAESAGLIKFNVHDLRQFAEDAHRTIDDTPYGGGAGMLLKVEPLVRALESIPRASASRVLAASPQGRLLDQPWAEELSRVEQIIIVSGRYEGYDQRFIDGWVDEEFSIGNYVVSGGDLPAMVLIEAVGRLIPGTLGNEESVTKDSFSSGLLKYPQYTRPAIFRGMEVPEILRKGHHLDIEKWRERESYEQTLRKRPDLIMKRQEVCDDKK